MAETRKKRGQNEGGVYQRKDGRWEAQLTVPAADGGRAGRRSFYGRTKAEAVRKLRDAERDITRGLPVADGRLTVGAYLDRWLEDAVGPTVAPKTYASYSDTVRVHLTPLLGRIVLAKLGPADVQRLLAAKSAAGLSPTTVGYIRTVLRIALGRAEKWGLVARNAAALADAPRRARSEVRPLTPAEARRLLLEVEGDRLEALYRVAVSLGLRMGEALGLRWEDVDLDAGELRVERALQRVGGQLTLKEPKTEKSRRTLTLPPALARSLRAHRVRQLEERMAAGPRWEERGLVFTTAKGTPLEPSNVLKRFKAHLAAAGLPPQRFHDLRHCAASLLLAQGVPARVVMDVLGHTQISTTMDLYAHVMPAAHREAAARMEEILGETG